MRKEIMINGFKFWLDDKNIIYSSETEPIGIPLNSRHVTPNEKKTSIRTIKIWKVKFCQL